MDNASREHLVTALENRDFAHALIDSSDHGAVAVRWAAAIAFYAAVHYVNAYLWERLRIEPANHQERGEFVSRVSDLRLMRRYYIHLQAFAFDARYSPSFRPRSEVVRDLIEVDLEAVRVAVLRVLDAEADKG